MKKIINKQTGFGIVELMIAIALGILITGGLIQLFATNKTSFRMQDGLARQQENFRFAHYYLSREIRMAGYNGCGGLNNVTPIIQANNVPPGIDLTFNLNQVIEGYQSNGNGSWSPALPSNLTGKVADDSDVIVIKNAAPESVLLSSPMVQSNTAMHVINRLNILQGDIILITDCEKADIFYVTNVANSTVISHGSNGNFTAHLSKAYQTDAFMMRFNISAFYLKDTGRTSTTGTPIRALYLQRTDGTEHELVDGIEGMKVTYGVDTTGDGMANSFQTASTVATGNNWGNVYAVKISLLSNTIEEVSPTQQAYTFNGTTVNNPGDRLLRRQSNTFITLRNRSL